MAAMLYSFDHHLKNCELYYHNAIFNRGPLLSLYRKVDFVVFHHSVTTVWNRERFLSKIKSWQKCDFGAARKIALMQDEYKNNDLLQRFVQELSIERVFTLAPNTQWNAIYGNQIVNRGILTQYLAGYLETNEHKPMENDKRDIDIGYRTDWTKMHVKLGSTGMLKRNIAHIVDQSAREQGLSTNIRIGSEHFIKGDDWNRFLRRCRYVIGVPSGSSVLDKSGDIEAQLAARLRENPKVEENLLYREIVESCDGSLLLEVLSPRHFEAILNGCGQILIESDYNGVLVPWVHYLPLKRDFSNLQEIMALAADEELRLTMVRNSQRDIVSSQQYSYKSFVDLVIPSHERSEILTPQKKSFAKVFNELTEAVKKLLLKLRFQFI
ncbi:MAG: hypothetical protein AAF431_09310 [Pseudomonadota bacterium]